MPHNGKLAEITQELSFSAKFDTYREKHKRLDDVHASIDFLLARDPKQGTIVTDDFRVVKTTPICETPSFWVLYRYEEENGNIFLLSIEAIEESQAT